MARPEKVARVAKVEQEIRAAGGVYIAAYAGIPARTMTGLRRQLRQGQLCLTVVKNTLAARALTETCPLPDAAWKPLLAGQTALITGPVEYTAAARLLSQIAARIPQLKIRAAYVGGRLVTNQEFEFVANLPARPVLMGQLVASLMTPMVGVIHALSYRLSDLAFVLDEMAKQKEAS